MLVGCKEGPPKRLQGLRRMVGPELVHVNNRARFPISPLINKNSTGLGNEPNTKANMTALAIGNCLGVCGEKDSRFSTRSRTITRPW